MKNGNHAFYRTTVVFFLKNIWFSPSVNVLYIILGVLLLVLRGGGDLAPNDIFLAMLFLSFTGYSVRRIFCDKRNAMIPWFSLLPLSSATLLRLVLVSALLYSVIVQGVLIVLLHCCLGHPEIGNPEVSLVETGNGEVLSVIRGYIVDLDNNEVPYRKELRPSLVFGIVTSLRGYPVFPFWHGALFLFFVALTLYFIVAHHIAPCTKISFPIFHSVVCGVCTGIGMVTIADFLVPGRLLWLWRTRLDSIVWIVPVILVCLTLLIAVHIYRCYQRIADVQGVVK